MAQLCSFIPFVSEFKVKLDFFFLGHVAGDLLEESQSEASRLRQRVEELVRDNEALKSSSIAASLCTGGGPVQMEAPGRSHSLRTNLQLYFNELYSCYTSVMNFCNPLPHPSPPTGQTNVECLNFQKLSGCQSKVP